MRRENYHIHDDEYPVVFVEISFLFLISHRLGTGKSVTSADAIGGSALTVHEKRRRAQRLSAVAFLRCDRSILDGGLRGGEAGDGDSVGGTTDVV